VKFGILYTEDKVYLWVSASNTVVRQGANTDTNWTESWMGLISLVKKDTKPRWEPNS